VHLAGGDTDLGAHAELSAIGELGRGIVDEDRGIDLVEETADRSGIFRQNRFGVVRRIFVDMADRTADTVDDSDGDDRVEIFSRPVFLGCRLQRGVADARISQPASVSASIRGNRCVPIAALSTSKVSAAPHTPVLRILALTTMLLAMSRSAVAST
jgi:hypothetical protein